MAKYNLDFYSGEDLYSDGDIERKILELVRQGVKLEDIDEPCIIYPRKEKTC